MLWHNTWSSSKHQEMNCTWVVAESWNSNVGVKIKSKIYPSTSKIYETIYLPSIHVPLHHNAQPIALLSANPFEKETKSHKTNVGPQRIDIWPNEPDRHGNVLDRFLLYMRGLQFMIGYAYCTRFVFVVRREKPLNQFCSPVYNWKPSAFMHMFYTSFITLATSQFHRLYTNYALCNIINHEVPNGSNGSY